MMTIKPNGRLKTGPTANQTPMKDPATPRCSRGPLFILSGPSGTGKTTLINRLLTESVFPLRLSVSVTTRGQRPGEQDARDYHFWSRERFLKEQKEGSFLEWADVYGNYYGTLANEVEPFRQDGTGVLLDIDTQGWEQVKRFYEDALSIFIRTSSEATYEKRLRDRGTETEAAIQKRLQGARRELARAPEYDYEVINDDLETALAKLKDIIYSACGLAHPSAKPQPG